MRYLRVMLSMLLIISMIACNSQADSKDQAQKNEQEPTKQPEASNGQLIDLEKAKTMVKNYFESSRASNPNEEPTVSVHYTKADFEMLFNQHSFLSEVQINKVKYDGVRIYFGRYDSSATRVEDRNKNTLVLILTKLKSPGYYEDIIVDGQKVTVLPLNDGSRCKPNCGGNLLFAPPSK